MKKSSYFTYSVYQAFGIHELSTPAERSTVNQHLARVRELSRYKFVFQGSMWLIYYRSKFAGVIVPGDYFSMHQGKGDQQDARQAFKDQMPKLTDKYLSLLEKHAQREVERAARRQTAVVPKAQPQAAQQPGKSKKRKNRNRRQGRALQPA